LQRQSAMPTALVGVMLSLLIRRTVVVVRSKSDNRRQTCTMAHEHEYGFAGGLENTLQWMTVSRASVCLCVLAASPCRLALWHLHFSTANGNINIDIHIDGVF